jgi:hypothetical protein
MSANLYDAHKQWASRPPDERFSSLDALLEFTGKRKSSSVENLRRLHSLRVFASHGGAINLNGHLTQAILTNWAFSQLCQRVGAPAGYLRTVSPDIAAQCLEYGLVRSGEECKILTRKTSSPNGSDIPNQVAAFTSAGYGRIWDHDVLTELMESIHNTPWHTPPGTEDGGSGLYASDRDMFVFFINDDKPIEVESTRLSRGFFCWNSETGAATFGLTTFLYNHVCANHIVWEAEEIEELRIFHRRRAVARFYEEALPALNRFIENHKLDDRIKDVVYSSMNEEVGATIGDTLAWFKTLPFCGTEIEQAWQRGRADDDVPATLWDMVQGLTAYAKTLPFTDKRVELEKRAGMLLGQ